MDTHPLPSAEKKRARTRPSKKPIWDILLRPTTWKAAMTALDFGLKLVRVCAKIWDMFG